MCAAAAAAAGINPQLFIDLMDQTQNGHMYALQNRDDSLSSILFVSPSPEAIKNRLRRA